MHPKRLDITDLDVATAVMDCGGNKGAAARLGCTTGLIQWRLKTMRRETKLARGPESQYDKHIGKLLRIWERHNNIVQAARHCGISKTVAGKYLHRYYGEVKGRLPWVRKVSDRKIISAFKEFRTHRKIAKVLGISHNAVWYRLKKLKIRKDKIGE
jgi:hypothetical protein